LVTVPHSVFARWRKNFYQLLNENRVKVVRQIEIRIAEPLAECFEFEIASKKLKSLTSPGIVQIPAEPIKAGLEQFALRSINLLIIF
jgi:hypothetical protein